MLWINALLLGALPALRLSRPSSGEMDAFVRRQRSKGLNCRETGLVLRYLRTGERPSGLQLCERSAVVGHGRKAYERARGLLRKGKLLSGVHWAAIHFVGDPAEARDLATVAQCYRAVWSLNPCRVTHLSLARTRSTLAYATLEGHLLDGEEAIDVCLSRDGSVRVRVASLSKGSGWLGALAVPFIVPIRRAFLSATVASFAAATCEATPRSTN